MQYAFLIIFVFLIIGVVLFMLPTIISGEGFLTLVGGSDLGIYKSSDGGLKWSQQPFVSKRQSIKGLNIMDIAVDPQNPSVIFIGSKKNGVFKSVDAGETWVKLEDLNKILSVRADVYRIAVDPKNSDNVYAAAFQGSRGIVVKSRDGGASFTQIYFAPEENKPVLDVKVDPNDSKYIYIATAQGGVLQSRDYGQTWRVLEWFTGIANNIAVNPRNSNEIYVTLDYDGFFKSTNRGESWINLTRTLDDYTYANRIQTIAIDPTNPSVIYLGSHYGLLRSENGGGSFRAVNLIVPSESLPALSIVINPKDGKTIYVSASSEIYKTVDRGESWKIEKTGTTRKVEVLRLNPENPEVVYAGIIK